MPRCQNTTKSTQNKKNNNEMLPESIVEGKSWGTTKTNVLQKESECLESWWWRSSCKRINSAACGRVVDEVIKKTEGTLKLRPLCAAPFLKKALWVHRRLGDHDSS